MMRRPPAASAAAGLLDRARRLVEEVQHLVDDDEVEAVAHDREVQHVAEPDARIRDSGALQIGAGDCEHRRREVDAERALAAAGEKLQHPAGAGADVEHGAERPLARALQHRRFDLPLRHVQRADGVPAAGVLGEIALRRFAVLRAAGRPGARCRASAARRGVEPAHDAERHLASRIVVGEAVIDPGAFGAARRRGPPRRGSSGAARCAAATGRESPSAPSPCARRGEAAPGAGCGSRRRRLSSG